MKVRYELTKKNGSKVVIKNFWDSKSLTTILGGLKQKVGIFIGTKKCNPKLITYIIGYNMFFNEIVTHIVVDCSYFNEI